jgi:predicted  nucleic acid-binding Zn-ribbon protein
MNNPTKYEVKASIDARRLEIINITNTISELEHKIQKLNQRKQDLRNLNSLDIVLLRELEDGNTD